MISGSERNGSPQEELGGTQPHHNNKKKVPEYDF